ncbi:hypothetical protein JCM10908_002799 [Rhodotorula pacifica]|uniref:uncharacterized protein n=1 Tax=Rhodotorula pacifica TaxID=1495444 RepID=UPI00316C103D
MSWLDALPQHPVWTLPPPPPASTAAAGHDVAAPNTPGTPSSHTRQQATMSQSASSQSLFGLAASKSAATGSTLARSTTNSSSARQAGAGRTPSADKDRERRLKGARTSTVAVVRGADLIVAVGSELRIASLAQVKANAGADYDRQSLADRDIGEYKVLHTPTITFDIQQLVLNPTSKLLAVVGAHSVVVVVLPRRGWSSAVGKTIECRCLPIGAFYHSLPGSPAIASALWHPLGADASSLLLLTTDCTLREYTVSEDVSEPAQVVSFSRSGAADKKGKAGGRLGFSAIERDAETAAAMCVGQGKADWGPLTLYALMRNGDVVSLCPFLPKKTEVSPSYIRGLSAFVSTKVDYLSSSLSSSLSKTIKPSLSSSYTSNAATEAKRLEILETRYNLQLSYVQSLSRQLSSATSGNARSIRNGSDVAGEGEGDVEDDDEPTDPDAPVRVTAPSRPNLTARVQGPFLMQPAPAELDNGADDRACDLVYLSTGASSAPDSAVEADDKAGLGVLLLAFKDGKVDVCLEVEKPEARFVGEGKTARSRTDSPAPSKGAVVLRRRGFGAVSLDDDDGDDEEGAGVEGEGEDDLPTLAVYESIDLGLAAELNPNEDDEASVRTGLRHNAPRLVRDPLYSDTVYVQHALGAHSLLLGPWLDELAAAAAAATSSDESKADEEGSQELKQALAAQKGTEVLWVLKTKSTESTAISTPAVEGLVVLNDVYLGYSLLLVTSALQVVGIELSLRIEDASLDIDTPASTTTMAQESAYVSLLDKPFSVPPFLSSRRPGANPALPRLPPSRKPLEITPDTLRAFATHVSSTQTAIRDLVSAADSVQSRLELQMRELSRQVEKLAELERLRSDLGKSVSGGTEGRLRRAEEKQRELLARTDRVLQRLVESHQPSISTYERKWFDELERLEEQVVGRRSNEDGNDEDEDDDGEETDETRATSLEMRAKRVEAMFDALRPGLEDLKRKKDEAGSRSVNGTPGRRPNGTLLGQNQVKVLEERLAEEARLLAETKKKVDRLASSLSSTSLRA